ncbi:DNRLRE domain-containing protein, partial [Candidatus Bathyarchaeota archaeon]|nr:DNRLRE domain-containing protein [Candidatus Bathyarchaeota archaeon]
GGVEPVYVDTERRIEVDVELFGSKVYGAPVSVLSGMPKGRVSADGKGSVEIPSGSRLLRVACLYNASCSTAPASRDVNRDGPVDLKDIVIEANAFGAIPSSEKWDWRADVDFDLKVDLKDYMAVAVCFGKTVKYVGVADFSCCKAVWFNGESRMGEAWLDRWGCVWIPFMGVDRVNVSLCGKGVGAVIEFFHYASYGSKGTNNAGRAEFAWVPEKTGTYFVWAGMPPSFLTLAEWQTAGSVSAVLSCVLFLDVVKKTVSLSLDCVGEFNVATIEADADASVYAWPPDQNFGNEHELYVGLHKGCDLGYAYLHFDLSSIPSNAHILSARLNLHFDLAIWDSHYEMLRLNAYFVTQPWDEQTITWDNKPSYAEDPCCSILYGTVDICWPRYWFIDAGDAVRKWLNGSVPNNYGLVLQVEDLLGYNWTSIGAFFSSREVNGEIYERPALEVSYILPSPSLVVNAYDCASQSCFSDLNVNLLVDGVNIGSVETNSSGVATLSSWRPTVNKVYNVTAFSCGNLTHADGKVSCFLDFRFPTNIASPLESPVGVIPGEYGYEYELYLVSSGLFGISYCEGICGRVNGTGLDGMPCSPSYFHVKSETENEGQLRVFLKRLVRVCIVSVYGLGVQSFTSPQSFPL